MIDVARALKDSGQRGLRRHQRQRDRARRRERAHALGRDRAHRRRRDDPAPDDARRDDHGPRVAAPRRARVRHPQRPRGDRRPARGRRLPGLARRLRDRLDRPRAADGAPEPAARTTTAARSTRRPRSTSASRSTRPPTTSTPSSSASSRKVEAGAHFAMTQILFDLEYMDRFVELLGGEWPIPVLVGIFPVWSHQLALRLHNEVPGIVVPDRVLDALARRGPGCGRGRDGDRPRAARGLARPRAGRLRRRAVPPPAWDPRPAVVG